MVIWAVGEAQDGGPFHDTVIAQVGRDPAGPLLIFWIDPTGRVTVLHDPAAPPVPALAARLRAYHPALILAPDDGWQFG
jgi:hypothetical protein